MEGITTEKLQIETTAENLIFALETAKKKVLKKIKRKRRKLIKFIKDAGFDFEDLTKKWSRTFVTVSLAAGIFLTTALPVTYASLPQIKIEAATKTTVEKELLRQKLLEYLQKTGRKGVNENLLASLVSQISGLSTRAILDDNKIPQVYGRIATEQHLELYPGENLSEHLQGKENFDKFSSSGMSQSSAAWGYFAKDKNEVTPDLIEKEKYYLAIQTFNAKGWNTNWPTLKDWYKFRKLLVYNPENGRAVVGVVGDAGPAVSTGRAFGGSPEVMDGLGTTSDDSVLVFFLDDPSNQIPLGPVLSEQVLAGTK